MFPHLQDVSILDVRGRVQTKLHSENAQGCRLEMSEYFADYDTYLEGHIPGEITSSPAYYATLYVQCNILGNDACCLYLCTLSRARSLALASDSAATL